MNEYRVKNSKDKVTGSQSAQCRDDTAMSGLSRAGVSLHIYFISILVYNT